MLLMKVQKDSMSLNVTNLLAKRVYYLWNSE